MDKRQNVLCALVICITVVALAENGVCQQKSRRRNKPSEPVKATVLSRARAADLIMAYPGVKSTYMEKIPVGRFWSIWSSIERDSEFGLQALAKQGLLQVRETGARDLYLKEYIVELTPEGEKEAKAWVKTIESIKGDRILRANEPDVTVYRLGIAERQVEVTGIAIDTGGKTALATVVWRWVPTALAKLLPKKLPSNELHGKVFYFRLFDDGWRVVGQDGMPLGTTAAY